MVVLPNGQPFVDVNMVYAYDGLGTDGAVVYNPNPWFTFGEAHVFIFTGADPEPYGTFTLPTPPAIVARGKRPICVLSAAWTNPDYSFGYSIPRWPWHSLQQDAYDINLSTVSFRWDSVLSPFSSYSIDIICGRKS